MNKIDIINCISMIMRDEMEMNIVEPISPSSQLEALGVDSIGLMTLGVYLEEKLDVELSVDFFAKAPETIGDIVSIVNNAMDNE